MMGSLREPMSQLATTKSSFRLKQIDKIRAIGVGNHVSLPQIVVCGDQSAGKSSVLERLTDIPFPRNDGLCTRFATEIILRHSGDGPWTIIASINPHDGREPASREALQKYRRDDVAGFDELPSIIEEAGSLMGLCGYDKNTSGSAFALDTLRIEVSGPTGVHLTIVDLPGLISVANEEQSNEDVQVVHHLVERYLESSRTIILAVVQATNDIANQPIVQKAKKFDPDGTRTVGIITKPDLVNKGTEDRIVRLANNEDNVKLELGFFLLKNPSPQELEEGWNPIRVEKDFFATKPWNQVDPDRAGALPLKGYLQGLLYEHIEKEIPKVKEELKKKLSKVETQLHKLGKPRPTPNDIRSFLMDRSMTFHRLVQDALQGQYLGSGTHFFHGETRLRATVHRLNEEFSERMLREGLKRVIQGGRRQDLVESDEESMDGNQTKQLRSSQKRKKKVKEMVEDNQTGQLTLSHEEMLQWVKGVYTNSRGQELCGNYNHTLLTELFQDQSSRWLGIATDHLEAVGVAVRGWLSRALEFAIQEDELRDEVTSICHARYKLAASRASEELATLWGDERRQPITYNHYYTDNAQKARIRGQKGAVKEVLQAAIEKDFAGRMHISNLEEDVAKISEALQSRVVVDMDKRACEEALVDMNAYYKVSRKTFVDNVCRQVIERHILVPLPTYFSPTTVSEFDDEKLKRIGSEPEKRQLTREKLMSSADTMRQGLAELDVKPPPAP